MGRFGPFWPSSNEAKRGQGGSSAAHLSQFLTPNGHKSVHDLWKPSEATRSAPRKDSPSVQGKTSLSSIHSILKDQEWCIYGIIYHYAQFFLRHPMVTLSEPNYVVPNQVPSPSPFFEEGLFSYSVWQFPGSYQKTIQGPQPPGPAEVGLSFTHQEYYEGNFQRLSIF
ncbi:hypothetical protein O181_068513 [Austropuccinia psidii MF-1]|uniref:Uncharacterized protein n=1 Tax=Austropuccinia psidii MF-1 TaxID=1389203 RepID=A0A9Q3EVE3_9BASI|nr:hypothetical protein [Austropuccinia psidii MF-1]